MASRSFITDTLSPRRSSSRMSSKLLKTLPLRYKDQGWYLFWDLKSLSSFPLTVVLFFDRRLNILWSCLWRTIAVWSSSRSWLSTWSPSWVALWSPNPSAIRCPHVFLPLRLATGYTFFCRAYLYSQALVCFWQISITVYCTLYGCFMWQCVVNANCKSNICLKFV